MKGAPFSLPPPHSPGSRPVKSWTSSEPWPPAYLASPGSPSLTLSPCALQSKRTHAHVGSPACLTPGISALGGFLGHKAVTQLWWCLQQKVRSDASFRARSKVSSGSMCIISFQTFSVHIYQPLCSPFDDVSRRNFGVSQVVRVVKNLPANARDTRDAGSIPRLGRSPGGGHGNPLQYSYPENPKDRGMWRAIAHRVTESGI